MTGYHRELREVERGGLAPSSPKTPRMISRPTVRPMVVESAPTSAPPATCATVLRRPPAARRGRRATACRARGAGACGLRHARRQHLPGALAVDRLAVLGQQVGLADVGLQLFRA